MAYLILVTLHVLAAVVWIGGMLFLGVVLTPVLRGHPPAERAALLRAVGRRFLKIAWTALAVLLLTGPILWSVRAFQVTPTLGAKLVLVAVILYLSVVHDFSLGPRLVDQLERGGEGEETARLRRQVAFLARLNTFLAVAVLILGVTVSRGF